MSNEVIPHSHNNATRLSESNNPLIRQILDIREEMQRLQAELTGRTAAVEEGEQLVRGEQLESDDGIEPDLGDIEDLIETSVTEGSAAIEGDSALNGDNSDIDKEILLAMAARDIPRVERRLQELQAEEERLLSQVSKSARKEIETVIAAQQSK